MAIAFRRLPKAGIVGSNNYVFRHYGVEPLGYLCFTAEKAQSTVAMSVCGAPTEGQEFETSTNGVDWSAFIPGTTTISLTNVGDKVYFRGNNTTVSESSSMYYSFVMTGLIAASGNIMSLLDKTCQSTVISSDYCYYDMFIGCTSLTTAPALPATNLSGYCYYDMFRGCTSLTTAPALPATALVDFCYSCMFYGCTSLTTAPALPATNLSGYCYYDMFRGCTSLTTAPALPATNLSVLCYYDMFRGCTSLQVYSSYGTGHTKTWRIPKSGNVSPYTTQGYMFYGCPGDYETSTEVSLNTTFYTQNTPVS